METSIVTDQQTRMQAMELVLVAGPLGDTFPFSTRAVR